MNSKQAKTLKILAEREAKEKGYSPRWAYKQIKALWNKTPSDKKKTVFG